MMDELQAMNTQAVDLMGEGEYEEAAEIFAVMVSDLSRCRVVPAQRKEQLLTGEPSIDIYFSGSVDRELYCVHGCAFESNIEDPEEEEEEETLTEEEHCAIAVICLFNLGLCYQSVWANHSKGHSFLLRQALEHYHEAFCLAKLYSNRLDLKRMCPRVLQAVFCNAAHCARELADLQLVQFWNERLTQMIYLCHDLPEEYHQEGYQAFFRVRAFHNRYCGTAAQAA